MTGKKFGKLTVVEFAGKLGSGLHRHWACKCECGNRVVVDGGKLRSGHTRSCGCLVAEKTREASVTHGLGNTPEYSSWYAMISRCFKKEHRAYPQYGGSGITVCDGLRRSPSGLVAAIGLRPSRAFSLDRWPLNDGSYTCGACGECKKKKWSLNIRWATRIQQQNNMRNNKRFKHQGKELTISQWSRELGMSIGCICGRLARGWSIHDALSCKQGESRGS